MVMTREDFNQRVLENIGLEIDCDNYIVDQDTGDRIQIRGKLLKTQDVDYDSIEYNPLDNPMMMNKLFGYFLYKNEQETGVGTRVFSHSTNNKKEKGYVELVQEDNTVYKSSSFYNDSLKYADIIFRMNSDLKPEDMKHLDLEIVPKGVRRRVSAK